MTGKQQTLPVNNIKEIYEKQSNVGYDEKANYRIYSQNKTYSTDFTACYVL